MPEDISPDLLFSYVTGTATPAGVARVEAWAATNSDNARLVIALQQLPQDKQESANDDVAADVDLVWQQIHEVLAAPRRRRPLVLMPRGLPNWITRVAAAIVLTTAAAGAYWLRARPATSSIEIAYREIVTAEREMRRVSLPDGSGVLLAPASKLRYPSTFNGATRHVGLVGRAYFQVAHDKTRPFIVHARNVDTRVLGTQFVVGAYPTDSVVQVLVQSGRVAVSAGVRAEPLAILEHGARADVRPDGHSTVSRNVDLTTALGWTRGTLEFARVPLPEVLAEFQRWYGLSIHVADPDLRRQLVNGSYDPGKPEQALRLLAAALGTAVVHTADGIRLVR